MRKFHKCFILVMILTVTSIITACGDSKTGGGSGSGNQNLSLLTGGTGGTYYPLGGQIGKIISDKTKANITPQTSGASAENMETLRVGEAEIAFSQTDIAAYALEGKEMFDGKPIDNILAISTLYPETVQIVTTAKSGIKSVEDLKGKKVSVGAPGSGAYINAMQILEIHGLSEKDIKGQNLSFDESAEGIQAGNIDAAFITAGTPTGAVEALSVQNDIIILPIAEDKIQALVNKYPYYAEDTIPSGTYKIKSEVKTVAVKAMLVVKKDLDEDLVYEMTKAVYNNTDQITHAKGDFITAETALEGLGDMEVHPGAAKYFKEKGVSK
ncbi:TAXI family TRAP transporter solute-binding subunit [Peribacillus sp. RS7]|uniref:TAXI family TRAP transporter solute-binding subunit n=1 Tax=Peribacillus sp. RS7 TaxID=3242679 RepID=UPI0035C03A91